MLFICDHFSNYFLNKSYRRQYYCMFSSSIKNDGDISLLHNSGSVSSIQYHIAFVQNFNGKQTEEVSRVIKLVFYYKCKTAAAPGKPCHSSLMFSSRTEAYLSESPFRGMGPMG